MALLHSLCSARSFHRARQSAPYLTRRRAFAGDSWGLHPRPGTLPDVLASVCRARQALSRVCDLRGPARVDLARGNDVEDPGARPCLHSPRREAGPRRWGRFVHEPFLRGRPALCQRPGAKMLHPSLSRCLNRALRACPTRPRPSRPLASAIGCLLLIIPRCVLLLVSRPAAMSRSDAGQRDVYVRRRPAARAIHRPQASPARLPRQHG